MAGVAAVLTLVVPSSFRLMMSRSKSLLNPSVLFRTICPVRPSHCAWRWREVGRDGEGAREVEREVEREGGNKNEKQSDKRQTVIVGESESVIVGGRERERETEKESSTKSHTERECVIVCERERQNV